VHVLFCFLTNIIIQMYNNIIIILYNSMYVCILTVLIKLISRLILLVLNFIRYGYDINPKMN